MATFVFKLPDVGEGIAEAEIVQWHVKVGDMVAEDQPLVDVMTDKATVEISAPVAGNILSCKGELGQKVRVGDELVTFATGAASPETSTVLLTPVRAAAAPPPQPKSSAGGMSSRPRQSGRGRRRWVLLLKQCKVLAPMAASVTKTSTGFCAGGRVRKYRPPSTLRRAARKCPSSDCAARLPNGCRRQTVESRISPMSKKWT